MKETVEEFLARGGAIKELDAVPTKEIITPKTLWAIWDETAKDWIANIAFNRKAKAQYHLDALSPAGHFTIKIAPLDMHPKPQRKKKPSKKKKSAQSKPSSTKQTKGKNRSKYIL